MAQSGVVKWALGPTTMDGTLVIPDGPGPFPAVVMAAGKGPTDRDWTSPLRPGNNGSAALRSSSMQSHAASTPGR